VTTRVNSYAISKTKIPNYLSTNLQMEMVIRTSSCKYTAQEQLTPSRCTSCTQWFLLS